MVRLMQYVKILKCTSSKQGLFLSPSCLPWIKLRNAQISNIIISRRAHSRNQTPNLEFSSSDAEIIVTKCFQVIDNFITTDEEKLLTEEIEPKWKRLKYQKGHWDNAIQEYRETEVGQWSDTANLIIDRIRQVAFREEDIQRGLIHVLDLSADGFIKPHVDSVKFCGRVIAGLSLLSPCVMRFIKEDEPTFWCKTLLKQRSLYIMSDNLRYDFSHEILKNEESIFHGNHVTKNRRISVLCRSEPQEEKNEDKTAERLFQTVPIPLNEDSESST